MRKNMDTLPGIPIAFIEVNNRVASEYMEEHYDEIVHRVIMMGKVDPAVVHDLVHDVYLSIVRDENNGYGFQCTVDGITRKPSEFIFGRIQGYARNKKYSSENKYHHEVSACSTATDEEYSSMTKEQQAYATACTYDEINSVDDRMSVCEEINYLLTFQSQVQIDIKFMLKNIGNVANMNFDKRFLADMKKLFRTCEEFAEAFKSVLNVYVNDTDTYEQAVAAL